MMNPLETTEPTAPTAPSWRRELAAVCCYFNPCHYQNRLKNYHLFRANVAPTGIHLLTVELAFGADEFELTGVDNLIQVRSSDVMWQKERLLNIGIGKLAEQGFTKVAWLDADIRFHNPRWPELTARALEKAPLIQIMSKAIALGPQPGRGLVRPGVIYHWQATKVLQPQESHIGLAWGARMDVLRSTGLYDAAVVGGADALIVFAPFCIPENVQGVQQFDSVTHRLQFNPARKTHYGRWANEFAALVQGKIGWVDGTVEALYHGLLVHRNYLDRQQILAQFDPEQDLTLNADQCWQWATVKPDMHRQVREYFVQRREDD